MSEQKAKKLTTQEIIQDYQDFIDSLNKEKFNSIVIQFAKSLDLQIEEIENGFMLRNTFGNKCPVFTNKISTMHNKLKITAEILNIFAVTDYGEWCVDNEGIYHVQINKYLEFIFDFDRVDEYLKHGSNCRYYSPIYSEFNNMNLLKQIATLGIIYSRIEYVFFNTVRMYCDIHIHKIINQQSINSLKLVDDTFLNKHKEQIWQMCFNNTHKCVMEGNKLYELSRYNLENDYNKLKKRLLEKEKQVVANNKLVYKHVLAELKQKHIRIETTINKKKYELVLKDIIKHNNNNNSIDRDTDIKLMLEITEQYKKHKQFINNYKNIIVDEETFESICKDENIKNIEILKHIVYKLSTDDFNALVAV